MTLKNVVRRFKALRRTCGQDLIEYSLMAGFVTVTAVALVPGSPADISTIFNAVASVMTMAAAQGS
jgi:Flp pilus assembly pilin Flp